MRNAYDYTKEDGTRGWRWWVNEVLWVGVAILCFPVVVVLLIVLWCEDYTYDPYFEKHD